jgi:hypothetical protein
MSAAVDRFREILKRYVGKDELLEVYDSRDKEDKFEVGFVQSATEESYSLATIDSKGRPDGIFVGRIDEIDHMAVGTQYLATIKLLNERYKSGEKPMSPPIGPFDDMLELVKYAHRNRQIVSVLIENYYTGFITDFSKEHIELLEVNRHGIEDGYQFLDLEQVSRIDIGSPTEDARRFLHQLRMGL